MDALDLIVLGRRLTRIGEEVMRGSKASLQPTGVTLVLRDVFANPDSSIGAIAARTGLPQSYASESVARLRSMGVVATTTDPSDGRRTLVRISNGQMAKMAMKAAISADDALAGALDAGDAASVRTAIDVLDGLARRLRPERPGPILGQIRPVRRPTPVTVDRNPRR